MTAPSTTDVPPRYPPQLVSSPQMVARIDAGTPYARSIDAKVFGLRAIRLRVWLIKLSAVLPERFAKNRAGSL